MSVTSTIYEISYTGNGSQTTFAIPFYFYALSNITVEVNNVMQAYSVNYVITGSADNFGAYPTGGNVVFQVGYIPSASAIIEITRSTPKVSIWAFVDGQPLTADAINHFLDVLLLIDQEEGAQVVTSTPFMPTVITGGSITLTPGNQWSIINANATSIGPCTINLPSATGSMNTYLIKKSDYNAFAVLVTPNGTDTIDGRTGSDNLTTPTMANTYVDFGAGTWLKY